MKKIEINHPIINQVLNIIEPMVDEAAESYMQYLQIQYEDGEANKITKKGFEYVDNYVDGKYSRVKVEKIIYVKFPIPSERDRIAYEEAMVWSAIKAMLRYFKTTDTLVELLSTRNSVKGFVLSGIVNRDGENYTFQSEVIVAGGYNIQCEHLRYITKTKLPSLETAYANKYVSNRQKLVEYNNDLEVYQKRIEDNKSKIANFKSFEDFKPTAKSNEYKYNPANDHFTTEEDFNNWKADCIVTDYGFYKTFNLDSPERDIKMLEKDSIPKLMVKIEKLKSQLKLV